MLQGDFPGGGPVFGAKRWARWRAPWHMPPSLDRLTDPQYINYFHSFHVFKADLLYLFIIFFYPMCTIVISFLYLFFPKRTESHAYRSSHPDDSHYISLLPLICIFFLVIRDSIESPRFLTLSGSEPNITMVLYQAASIWRPPLPPHGNASRATSRKPFTICVAQPGWAHQATQTPSWILPSSECFNALIHFLTFPSFSILVSWNPLCYDFCNHVLCQRFLSLFLYFASEGFFWYFCDVH